MLFMYLEAIHQHFHNKPYIPEYDHSGRAEVVAANSGL
jgi:hypothetical protein